MSKLMQGGQYKNGWLIRLLYTCIWTLILGLKTHACTDFARPRACITDLLWQYLAN